MCITCTEGLPKLPKTLTAKQTKELEQATAMKDYCTHCLEVYNELSSLGTGYKVPKEKLKALPGKRSHKKASMMSPEEYEQNRIFMRSYEDLYKEIRGEQIREYQRLFQKNYKKNHPEKLKASYEKRYRENPEYYNNAARVRRAKELSAYRESYSTDDVLRMWGMACHLCGELVDLDAPRHVIAKNNEGWQRGLQLDHVVPIGQGGPDIVENVKPAHAICNLSRGRDPVDLSNPPSILPPKVLNTVNMVMYYGDSPKGRRRIPR